MKKLKLFILLFLTTSFPIVCMEIDKWMHDPIRKNSIYELLELSDIQTKQILNDSENSEYGVCHDYAILKSINKIGLLSPQDDNWYKQHNVLKHFEKVENPQPGNLIIYQTDSLFFRLIFGTSITHTGLVYDKNKIESKWGTYPYILIHPTFCVPAEYGNHVSYYRKKESNEKIYQDTINSIHNIKIKKFYYTGIALGSMSVIIIGCLIVKIIKNL